MEREARRRRRSQARAREAREREEKAREVVARQARAREVRAREAKAREAPEDPMEWLGDGSPQVPGEDATNFGAYTYMPTHPARGTTSRKATGKASGSQRKGNRRSKRRRAGREKSESERESENENESESEGDRPGVEVRRPEGRPSRSTRKSKKRGTVAERSEQESEQESERESENEDKGEGEGESGDEGEGESGDEMKVDSADGTESESEDEVESGRSNQSYGRTTWINLETDPDGGPSLLSRLPPPPKRSPPTEQEEVDYLHTRDDEPVPQGRMTFGVELEFLIAAVKSHRDIRDPHRRDRRWLSNSLYDLTYDADGFYYTMRNKVVDLMREAGIVAIKNKNWVSDQFPYLHSLETPNHMDPTIRGKPQNDNDLKLTGWVPTPCVWWDNRGANENIRGAVRLLVDSLVGEHGRRGAELHITRPETIESIAETRLAENSSTLIGNWDRPRRRVLRWHFQAEMRARIKEAWESWETMQKDPLHVPVKGLADRYKAWQGMSDSSVSSGMIDYGSYEYPERWSRPKDTRRLPPDCYGWWGAEVVSPVYDIDSAACKEAVEKCCGALREAMRIHKPMSAVGNGLHIHIGQEFGWNLLHLKRVATMWLLIEEYMYWLQRKDRDRWDYCTKTRIDSKLRAALYGDRVGRHANARILPAGGTALDAEYEHLMRKHVPIDELTKFPGTDEENARLRGLVRHIWRYPTISTLCSALNANSQSEGLRWRISGKKSSVYTRNINTIEFRIMQGTLDAEHIIHWIEVIKTFVRFCETASEGQFRRAIRRLARGQHMFAVLPVPGATVAYYNEHTDKTEEPLGKYWEYEDQDRPLWTQVFMVPGYRDTHKDPASYGVQ